MRTNRVLQRLAQPLEPVGLLYGSALANLLRDDGRFCGTLPNRAEALTYGAEVLRFVVSHMPRLQRVVCLGAEAWECACSATGLTGDWKEHRDSGRPLGQLVAAYHPSARVSRGKFLAGWHSFVARWRTCLEP